jgi:hypothetical protein
MTEPAVDFSYVKDANMDSYSSKTISGIFGPEDPTGRPTLSRSVAPRESQPYQDGPGSGFGVTAGVKASVYPHRYHFDASDHVPQQGGAAQTWKPTTAAVIMGSRNSLSDAGRDVAPE